MTATPTPNQQAEDAQYYRQVLHDLIDMGTDLARQIHAQATTEPTPETPTHAQAFDRIARTVRRTILLARKVAEPIPAQASPANRREAARKRILRDVEDTIQRTTPAREADTLHAELLDRLDAPDLLDDIDHRPIDDIIADICRDLGIAAPPGTRPWKRRTPADVATLCARAAATPPPLQRGSGPLPLSPRERAGVRACPPHPTLRHTVPPPARGRESG